MQAFAPTGDPKERLKWVRGMQLQLQRANMLEIHKLTRTEKIIKRERRRGRLPRDLTTVRTEQYGLLRRLRRQYENIRLIEHHQRQMRDMEALTIRELMEKRVQDGPRFVKDDKRDWSKMLPEEVILKALYLSSRMMRNKNLFSILL